MTILDDDPSSISLAVPGRSVRLAYVAEGDQVFLISTDSNARWPSHILRERSAVMNIGGKKVEGVPALIKDEMERQSIIQMFKHKYGETYVAKYFSHPSRMIRVDLGNHERNGKNNYYEWLEEEFDSVANDYDAHISGNVVNVLLRNRSLKVLKSCLKRNSYILEIGCGTGAETIELLREGHQVLAMDISGMMLENLRKKAIREGVAENLRTCKSRASLLGLVLNEEGEKTFDMAYSTYGALNCEPNLSKVVEPLSLILKPNGYFVAGIYNKFCLSETLIHAASFKFNRIFWRFHNPILEGRSRFCIDVYSFTPSEFFELFRDRFSLRKIIGVPLLFPPSNFKKLFPFIQNRYDQLNRLDEALSQVWPTKFLGDHFLMVMSNVR